MKHAKSTNKSEKGKLCSLPKRLPPFLSPPLLLPFNFLMPKGTWKILVDSLSFEWFSGEI